MKKIKKRLDAVLVAQGHFSDEEAAKRAVMAGLVFCHGQRMDKPGQPVVLDAPLTIKGKKHNYVSRGGLKLEKALSDFNLDVTGKVLIDIGASTGGFTDCALQHGAKMSYAIDVGYNQLAWKLRQDPRVIVMERTNFRHVVQEDLGEGTPNFATIDVSFISLKLILPVLKRLLANESDVIALVKPQFEAPREQVGEKGIVRESTTHVNVLMELISFAVEEGYEVVHSTFSPITGGYGNIEFLLHLRWVADKKGVNLLQTPLETIVKQAHQQLN